MNHNLLLGLQMAISALYRHGLEDAAMCLEVELSLYQQGRVSAHEARAQANQFLALLA